MMLKPLIIALAAIVTLPVLAQSQLTVVNFGGANGAAQKKAYFEAFEKSGAGKVTQVEYNGEQAKIKAMVEAKKVTWDVVEVEGPDVNGGCDEGLLERWTGPRWATRPTSSPLRYTSAALAPLSGPRSWPTTRTSSKPHRPPGPISGHQKFPGKRGMRKGARYT